MPTNDPQMSGSDSTDGADHEVYYAKILVGTPPKKFRVRLDTSAPACPKPNHTS